MAIDFPNTPTVGETYTVGSKTWQWNGEKWVMLTSASNTQAQLYDVTVLMKMETY